MPHRVKLTFAVGAPIRPPKPPAAGQPVDPAVVDRVHAQYVAALQQLFEKHKAEAGYGDRQLELLHAPSRDKGKGGATRKKAE